MIETTGTCVVIQRFSAPPEKVFDAFLDVEVARHFMFATATGEMIEAELEAAVGGEYEFVERRPGMGDVRHVGQYLEIDRPRRLVFTFGVPQFDPRMTTVSIEIIPVPEGCRLTLTNDGVPPAHIENNRHGWTVILKGLLPAYEGKHGAGWLEEKSKSSPEGKRDG